MEEAVIRPRAPPSHPLRSPPPHPVLLPSVLLLWPPPVRVRSPPAGPRGDEDLSRHSCVLLPPGSLSLKVTAVIPYVLLPYLLHSFCFTAFIFGVGGERYCV